MKKISNFPKTDIRHNILLMYLEMNLIIFVMPVGRELRKLGIFVNNSVTPFVKNI